MKSSTLCYSLLAILSAAPPAGAQSDGAPLAATHAVADAAAGDDPSGTEWARWTSGRYRITPGDVLEIAFPFVPELTQTVTVQPDGFVTLRDIPDIRFQGRTVEQVRADVLTAYSAFVLEPRFTITLKEFEQPYFVANGEVHKPGRYALRGATTLTQALAMAGGTKPGARASQVVLYRRFGEDGLEAKQIDVSRMYARKDLSEDPVLRPGDTIVVGKSLLGKVLPVIELIR